MLIFCHRYAFDEVAGIFQQYDFGCRDSDEADIVNAQDGSGYNNTNTHPHKPLGSQSQLGSDGFFIIVRDSNFFHE